MAAIGSLTATTQIGQRCGARCITRVAGFQAITQQVGNDRRQSCSVSEIGSRAAMTSHGVYQCSAWRRGDTKISGHSQNFGSQSRGRRGPQISRSSANASNNNVGEDVRVDPGAREPEVLGLEEPAGNVDKALSLIQEKKAGQNANVAEKALDEGSTVATSALDKVGEVLQTTGLEINLDVGLKELTIEKLVLRDLGLVLAVKTKPKPQPGPPLPEEEEEGNNTPS